MRAPVPPPPPPPGPAARKPPSVPPPPPPPGGGYGQPQQQQQQYGYGAPPPPPGAPPGFPQPPPAGPYGQQQQQQQYGAPPPPPPPAAQPANAQLSIIYSGQRVVVNKDRFIIGRGKQSSDMTIKDPNVSRQHAMVEYLNGQYYMVDMGSTNGVEYNGQRIARKAIAEGDLFRICDHEVRFSYR